MPAEGTKGSASKEGARWRSLPLPVRIGLIPLAIVLAASAVESLASIQSKMRFQKLQVEDPFNGINLCIGLLLALLALLTLNAGLRGRKTLGPIDHVVKTVGFLVLLPAALIYFGGKGLPALYRWFILVAILINGFVFLPFLASEYRLDSHEVFVSQVDPDTVTSSGDILLGKDPSGAQRLARLTPALVRALDRAGISIGDRPGRVRELAMPGVVPLVVLFGLIVWGVLGQESRVVRHRRTMLWSGIVGLYVMGWMAIGQLGTELQISESPAQLVPTHAGQALRLSQAFRPSLGPISGEDRDEGMAVSRALERQWATVFLVRFVHFGVAIGIFLVAALLVALSVHQASERLAVDEDSMLGWTLLYMLVLVGGVCGTYVVSFTSPGSPVGPWVIAYGLLTFIGWVVTLPAH